MQLSAHFFWPLTHVFVVLHGQANLDHAITVPRFIPVAGELIPELIFGTSPRLTNWFALTKKEIILVERTSWPPEDFEDCEIGAAGVAGTFLKYREFF